METRKSASSMVQGSQSSLIPMLRERSGVRISSSHRKKSRSNAQPCRGDALAGFVLVQLVVAFHLYCADRTSICLDSRVRHQLYSGLVIAFWSATRIIPSHLVFSVM